MAKITSLELLRDYILRQLGAPLIQVELTDDQIDDIIEETIQEFSNHAMSGELNQNVIFNIQPTIREYTLNDDVQGVVLKKASTSSSGLVIPNDFVLDTSVLMNTFGSGSGVEVYTMVGVNNSIIDNIFNLPINYDYNYNTKKLTILDNYVGNVLMELSKEYIPQDYDLIYDHSWVKQMSVARCKLLQSDITGKYDQELVSGARINHDKMQQRAEQQIDILREELLTKWAGPAPILVG